LGRQAATVCARRSTRRSTSSRPIGGCCGRPSAGGDPDHALSWFGLATRDQRRLSTDVFAEAVAGERLPDDVCGCRAGASLALHGVLLYFLVITPAQRRTRKLIRRGRLVVDVDHPHRFCVDRRRAFTILRDAGLLGT
jgi:hypothetical protein